MPYAVLIAHQRSGTSAFGGLLQDGLDLKFHGEILDPKSFGPAINRAEGCATWPKVEAFLDQLHNDVASHLVDIKINSLQAVGQPFRSPTLPPALFELFRKHQAKIIRLHRDPASQWVSGLIATKTGVWHLTPVDRTRLEKVYVDPNELEAFTQTCVAEDRLVANWIEGIPTLELHYEQVFPNDDYSSVLATARDFIGCELLPNWQTAHPKLQKIAHPSLIENVTNASEISYLLQITDHGADGKDEQRHLAARLDLSDFDAPFRARIKDRMEALKVFMGRGVLAHDHFAGKVVLDWECGDGAFAAAFGLEGARQVIGSDRWLPVGNLPQALLNAPHFRFRRAELIEFENEIAGSVDLVFANTVTEHLKDLPRDFAAARRVLKPGGYLMINHDNYFQPVGSHDHGFLNYSGDRIVRQGPDCWNQPTKCDFSKGYLADVARRLPWTWDPRNDAHKDPLNCEACHYFKRSQPWAHLIFQNEFDQLYPQASFSTGHANSSLNKVTIFQLRQFLIEAGFEIVREDRATIANEPPEALLRGHIPFTARDLQTNMYRVLARRKGRS